jgi:crotonobetainyl-CoA hydratase
MPYEFIKVEREDHVTWIILNRPEVMNAISPPMHLELQKAFDEFAADPDQWVGIVTGAGQRAFSAGSDLKGIAAGGRAPYPPSGYAGLIGRFDLDKPLIAAVNGVAIGGGFEIALACDLIIASETASFGLPEPKVGLAAVGGGLFNLSRQIPLKQAMGIVLTGRRVSAQEGLALGFVNEVVAADGLATAARRWASDILACSPMSIRASKQAVVRGLAEPSVQAALLAQATYPAMVAMKESEDCQEGPRAFVEKRPPIWRGR